MTVEEIKRLLRDYYDISQKIVEEFATISNCDTEKNKITLPSVNLTGLPGGKGLSSDLTANMALANYYKYYNDEIANCYKRIDTLGIKRINSRPVYRRAAYIFQCIVYAAHFCVKY